MLDEFLFCLLRLLQTTDSFFVQLFLFTVVIVVQVAHGLCAEDIEVLYLHVNLYLTGLCFHLGCSSAIDDIKNLFSWRMLLSLDFNIDSLLTRSNKPLFLRQLTILFTEVIVARHR